MRATATAIFGFAVLAAAGASRVAAQSIPSAYRFIERKQESGPFFGVMGVDRGRFGYGPGGGAVTGARWGVELAGPLSLEGVVGVVAGTRDVVNPGRPEGDRKVGEADANVLTMDGRLKFTFTGARTWHRLSPFILAGAGIALDVSGSKPADDLLDTEDRFHFGPSFFGTLGGGTRWFVSERLALRADGIFSLWKIKTPLGFADPALGFASVAEDEWVRGLQLTASAVLRW